MKLSVLRLRAQISLTHCSRSTSQVQLHSLHTSAELHIIPPSRQPSRQPNDRTNAIKPLPIHKITSMPKKTKESLSEVLRHNPVPQRRSKAMADPRHIPQVATFKEMAEARIAVLEGALDNLDTSAPMQSQTAKKVRNRKLKRDAYISEIRELQKQLESGQDAIDRPTSSIPTPRPQSRGDSHAKRLERRQLECMADSEVEDLRRDAAAFDQRAQETPKINRNDRYNLPDRSRPGESPHTPRPQGWRPGHIDEKVVLPSPSTPGTPDTAGRRDQINKPSRASGGVPEPSAAYIKQASLPPRVAPEPRHILIIIDLNGALIHRPDRRKPTLYIARTSTDLFLDYLFSRFKCMVWSAARPNNVDQMCRQLFPGKARNKLVAEWGRDKMGLSEEDYNKRTQVYKRLEVVWNDRGIQACHPLRNYGERWDQTNTVLIDDSREKGRSHPFNLLKVPEFEGQKESEDVLRMVAEYLDDLLVQEDVSAYMHKNPFKVTGDDS